MLVTFVFGGLRSDGTQGNLVHGMVKGTFPAHDRQLLAHRHFLKVMLSQAVVAAGFLKRS